MANKQTTIEIPVSPERTISLTKEEAKVLQRELNELLGHGAKQIPAGSLSPLPSVRHMAPPWPAPHTIEAPLQEPSHWTICSYENLNKDAPTQHGE